MCLCECMHACVLRVCVSARACVCVFVFNVTVNYIHVYYHMMHLNLYTLCQFRTVRDFSAGFVCLTLGVEGIDEPFLDNYCDLPVDNDTFKEYKQFISWPLKKGGICIITYTPSI